MAKAEDEWTSQQEGDQSEGREETGEHEKEDLSDHHEEQTSEWDDNVKIWLNGKLS